MRRGLPTASGTGSWTRSGPQAQTHVAAELGTADARRDRLRAQHPRASGPAVRRRSRRRRPVRILTSDGEFHCCPPAVRAMGGGRRGRHRPVDAEPFETFSERFLRRAPKRRARPDLRQPGVLRKRPPLRARRAACRRSLGPDGPWVVIDGYHALHGGRDRPFGDVADAVRILPRRRLQICHGRERAAPSCTRRRASARGPPITGWFAEFEDLTLPARLGRLSPRRHAVHGRDVRPIGPLPLQCGPTDAVGERPDHGPQSRRTSAACRSVCWMRWPGLLWAVPSD